MDNESQPETTASHWTPPSGLAEGMALVLGEEDRGERSPLVAWLARNPHLAGELAAFLATQSKLREALTPTAALGGGLQLRGELGQGGMGVVYRAYDPALRREVAVKQVLEEADLARFRFEAEAVASLDHPNVVRVHSYGEAGGLPYLVMPLLEGGSLADRLKELGPDRRMPVRDAAALVRDVALGAHHAHQRGLIHRDLKPGNVLLDRDGRPHVADFGLARRLDATTSTGAFAGTAAYMAPEQARGEKVLTTAVDVHALGVILFELLTGRKPFCGADAAAVLRKVVEEPAPLARSLCPAVPVDLEEVCNRCLQKDPRDRYPSAQELADDLSRFLNGEPVGPHRSAVRHLVARGMAWRSQPAAMGSWRVGLWGGTSVLVAMGWLQAAVVLGGPAWVGWAAMAYYLLAWAAILWQCLGRRWHRLNAVERNSAVVQAGIALACASCLPTVAGSGLDVVRALPLFLAIKGLGIFVHGQWYWGRLYLVGAIYLVLAALMPLTPVVVWPAVFGLLSGGVQVWAGLHLRGVDREADRDL